MNIPINSKFKLRERLGGGTFGEIYSAQNIITEEEVAVKLESLNSKNHLLKNESKVYRLLAGGVGIPNIRYYGTESDHNALVMDLLGKSIKDLFVSCGNKFSLKTTLMIADQMLTRVEYLHNKNLIHRDIKPENFVIGKGKKEGQIFMIDMGLSKPYCNNITHEHIPFTSGKPLIGTACYTSLNSHHGYEQSRRDDIEGVAYVLIHLVKGSLPWQGIKAKDKEEKNKIIMKMKEDISIDELCEGIPQEFATLLSKARNLDFSEKPDYSMYRQMFRELFIREGYCYDCIYQWTPRYSREEIKLHVATPKCVKVLAKNIIPAKVPTTNRAKVKSTLTKPKTSSMKRRKFPIGQL